MNKTKVLNNRVWTEVESEPNKLYWSGADSLIEELMVEVEGKAVAVKYDNPILEAQCTAYNQAIHDVLSLIKSKRRG